VHLELKGAERVGYTLEIITLPVREVVHRIDLPPCAGAVMGGINNAVYNRVTHVHVRGGHINACPEHTTALFIRTLVHAIEEIEVLLNGAVAIRTGHTGLCCCAFLLRNCLGALVINISQAPFDEHNGKVPQFPEIVRGIIFTVLPGEPQPPDVLLDRINVFDILFCRISVIEAKVALAAVLPGHAEIEAYGLRMSYVEVPVWLGRETGMHPASILPLAQILLNGLFNKML